MKRLILLLVCAVAVPLQAYTLLGTRWLSSPLAMHLQLGPLSAGPLMDGSTSWGAVAEDALAAWNAVLTNMQFQAVRDSTAVRARGNFTNNVFFTSNVYGDPWDGRTLAVTLSSYYRSTGAYAESDVLFNSGINWNSYRGAPRRGANGATLYDFRRVAIHEFGHVLGLGHPDVVGQVVSSVMNSTSDEVDTIQADDINGARAVYDSSVPNRPVIFTQPVGQTVPVGQAVELSATVTGTPAPTYQWRKDGNAITGATGLTFKITNATVADSGSYTLVATNTAGSTASSAAVVTVNAPFAAPAIANQPSNQTVPGGQGVTFSVTATGAPLPGYQWRKDGASIAGATAATYQITRAAATDAGSYSVLVSNSAGSVLSTSATLTVSVPPVIAVQPIDRSVTAGDAVAFVVTAAGSGPFDYQWLRNGEAVAGATAARFEIPNPNGSDRAAYSVVVRNSFGTVTSNGAFLAVQPASVLTNLSVRATMSAGQTLIVGAVLGAGSKDLLVRAAGPALNAFGLSGLADPRLDIFSGANLVASNDNWPAEHAPAFSAVGAFAFPVGSRDASILQSLSGSITIQSKGTGAGTLLVETYDSAVGGAVRLVNLSARNRVGNGADALIAGFAIAGTGTKALLIRAVGPTLASLGVTDALGDPVLRIADASGATVASNDNWSPALASTFAQVGAFALVDNSKDAAIVVNLSAGAAYTVLVSGNGGATGEALIEIYEVF